jgi:hypothetical protein
MVSQPSCLAARRTAEISTVLIRLYRIALLRGWSRIGRIIAFQIADRGVEGCMRITQIILGDAFDVP